MLERHLASLGPSGFHRVAYAEWPGPPGGPTLVCVHGLSRNAHDFDVLAAAMTKTHRVVCPDMPGRGLSEWLKDPNEYAFPTYLADCAALIARLDVESVDWVGTSMGAVIGFLLASQPAAPVRRLVVNDAGPFVSKEALAWLGTFIGADPTFDSIDAMEQTIRKNSAGFGALTDAQWRTMTLYLSRAKARRRLRLRLRPANRRALQAGSPRRRSLAVLGSGRLSDPHFARRAFERPGAERRRGDDAARAEAEARRVRRRRPRARRCSPKIRSASSGTSSSADRRRGPRLPLSSDCRYPSRRRDESPACRPPSCTFETSP